MTPINEIIIVGCDTPIDSELTALSSVLCIGDGNDVGLKLIERKLQGVELANNIRVDIHAHGDRDDEKQHYILDMKTEDFLKKVKNLLVCNSGKQELAIEWHLWSCYGGSANKATHILGENNSLITHINSSYVSTVWLDIYSCEKSIKHYLANPDKDAYTRWVEEIKYAFQPTTFNFNSSVGTLHLKNMRILQPGILENLIEQLETNNHDLKTIATVFHEKIKENEIDEEFKKVEKLGYLKNSFQKSIEINDDEARVLALGILMYLNNATEDQNFSTFKKYADIILPKTKVDSDIFGYTLLTDSSYKNNPKAVELFIKKHKADVNQADNNGVTSLRIAAAEGHIEVVRILLENEAEPDKGDNNGVTPLWSASREGHVEVAQKLLENGADVNKADNYGVTPLSIAARKGHTEVVRILLENGAKHDSKKISKLIKSLNF
ncbi:MAG TPA: ankyrin repeat domain-containing protein [Rickettsia endosymbiont of Pyrocoelia pectoralis]|nr:ankyrin repeat domain-containing protein [Rickettsia endosymbiont of Pyrocoelia pectoralis]